MRGLSLSCDKTRRRDSGVLRPERTTSSADCSHGDESCVTRFSGGRLKARRGTYTHTHTHTHIVRAR